MRRANQSIRTAGSTVLSHGNRSGRGPLGAETTLRPAEEESSGPVPGSLEAVEQEVEELRKAIESEHAEITTLSSQMQELFMRNSCEEYLDKLEKRIQVIENKHVEVIQWRIENVEKVRSQYQKGQFIASPEFSACGLGGFSIHFYPRGDDFCEEGYCSVYFHVPADTKVERTLFLGRARHGPAEADSLRNCGVSEMCVLSNQIDKATGSIVIGVDGLRVLSSPHIVETRTKIQLMS
eukprot:TRINITY_DN37008_c0_g1_i2.p1 TRINITY_DN37008_c0_g1~~TRINITY_DN37008_c0_g1_i2.p1  ORF type:complete len:237 (-),score=49.43 TRINITY_DN37008_c0_g1_i2:246-956(-)